METPAGTFRTPRPTGLARKLARMPIWLYRLRLGWLLGSRFLMITHTGRKSGLQRRTVLEVVRHDKATGMRVVASGWGERADWYRNLQKTPRVLIDTASERFEAVASRLSPEQAEQELLDYARRHPVAFRTIARRLSGRSAHDVEQTCRALSTLLPLIAFRPERKRT